ncbi:MAG: hypothetical protein VYB54_07705 [Pseudomonadota bacterium]|nr:hypothetical protein [Pseudomonadota bacterium]
MDFQTRLHALRLAVDSRQWSDDSAVILLRAQAFAAFLAGATLDEGDEDETEGAE